MMSLRALMLLAVLGLFASHEDASAKKDHTFHGTVVSVHHNKGKKHHGTITVMHHKGKGNSNAVTKTFQINQNTQIHAGGAANSGAAKLHKGLHVAIRHQGHLAEDITIGKGKRQNQQPK
jgi:hypothetical protein